MPPKLPISISYLTFFNSVSIILLYLCPAHTSSFKDRWTEQSPVLCSFEFHQPRAAMEIFMWSLGDSGEELKHKSAKNLNSHKWITLPQVHQPFLLYEILTFCPFFWLLACWCFCGSSLSLYSLFSPPLYSKSPNSPQPHFNEKNLKDVIIACGIYW